MNTLDRALLLWGGVGLAFTLGCRSVGIGPAPDPPSEPPASATTSSQAAPAATVASVPPAATRSVAQTDRPEQPPAPTRTSRPERTPTASPVAGPFEVTVDGQAVTRDSLPGPEAYYAELLAKHGTDLSSCYGEASPEPKTCEKPSSLGETELKQQVNVELILDVSGSMAERSGGETRLDVARRVLSEFVTTLPSTANVALRVYGHRGSSTDADKSLSCASSELVYPFQPLDVGQFQAAVKQLEPSGWTPLAASLDSALTDFERFDPAVSSDFVHVVTDGIETCDGDPANAAQQLHAASVRPIVNVVGFDVDPEATRQLRQVAQRGGGTYHEARGGDELASVFTSRFDWGSWTAYYNCRYGVALRQHNAATGQANRTMNCVQGHISREHNALTGEATRRFNDIHAAAIKASLAAGTPAASRDANALIARARENLEYATQQERQRYDRVYNAERAQWETATREAQAELERARKELDEIRERATQP